MKKIQKNISRFFIFMGIPALGFVASAGIARAQEDLPELPELVTCSGAACQWCDIFELLQRVFNTAEIIIFPLVVIFVIYGAILYVMGSTSGSEETLTKARATVTDGIMGLVLILLTFIIVNATITGLTGGKLENFVSVDCSVVNFGGGDVIPPPSSIPPDGGTPPGPKAQGSITEEEARDIMKNAQPRIGINHNACPNTTEKFFGCTNLAGMTGGVIDGILKTNEDCRIARNVSTCDITITGGTELDGHSSKGQFTHPGGYKVDFRKSPNLDRYIETFQYAGLRKDDGAPMYIGPNGAIFADEGNHWDVTFF